MKQWITPLFLLAALLGFTGCKNTGDIMAVGLGIDVTKIERASDGSFAVTWQVRNPNIVPYILDHSTHKLFIDGTLVGTMTEDSRIAIPAHNAGGRTDKLVLAGGGAQKLNQALSAGTANYRVETTAWMLIVDDDFAKSEFVGSGTVAVSAQ